MRGGFLLVFGFMALVLRFGGLGCLAGLLGSGTVHSKLVLLQYRSGVRLETTPACVCVALRRKFGTCCNRRGAGVPLLPLLISGEFGLHSAAQSSLAVFEYAVGTAGLACRTWFGALDAEAE